MRPVWIALTVTAAVVIGTVALAREFMNLLDLLDELDESLT